MECGELEEIVLEFFLRVPGARQADDAEELDLMVADKGVEGNATQVGELRRKELVFGPGKLQISEEQEGLRPPLSGFPKGPGHDMRAIVSRVTSDREPHHALRRLVGQ